MRSTRRSFTRTMLPVAAGAGIMIVILMAQKAVAALIDPTPHVGDIVRFDSGNASWIVAARRVGGELCLLDARQMRRSGGSISIEAWRPDAGVVHWAGGSTAAAPYDCGQDANLAVKTADLSILRQQWDSWWQRLGYAVWN